ncbi:PREDICTED: uncharacterized protein LOC106323027 [Brassica oleracea var. oleracea]|uniref:uncharacterized protein LOC106323027 n=1 Tax=Brassica oleracea var. oleracea TaxID=109376 RepID=UPI0006A6D872|nr:PREDICTED: uncharacterized protein LOC106323027 [Brassica oleracea var. oleracea]
MAGASSLHQAADPLILELEPLDLDLLSIHLDSLRSLTLPKPLQNFRFPHQPSLLLLEVVGSRFVPGLSPDNRATTMVNLESSSTTMDISPTTVSIQISGKGLDKLQILPSAKIKEIDFISAQYTTLSARAKGAPPPPALLLMWLLLNLQKHSLKLRDLRLCLTHSPNHQRFLLPYLLRFLFLLTMLFLMFQQVQGKRIPQWTRAHIIPQTETLKLAGILRSLLLRT